MTQNGVAERVVIVTGAGRGIGRGIALHLAKAGARLVISDIRADRLQRTADELAELGAESLALECDVADRAAQFALAERARARHGIVVNCFCPAATAHRRLPGDDASSFQKESWERMYRWHPMGRDGEPEADIAPVVLFLLSDACRYMTGETLKLDGGGYMTP